MTPNALQHRRRHFAGERALVLVVHVLRAERDRRSGERLRDRRNQRLRAARPSRRDRARAPRRRDRSRRGCSRSARAPRPACRFIFQFPAISFLRMSDFQRLDARQLAAFEIFQRRAAAGRDMGEACSAHGCVRERRGGVAAADYRCDARLIRERLADRASCRAANAGISKNPSGPFQMTVFARASFGDEIARRFAARYRGPSFRTESRSPYAASHRLRERLRRHDPTAARS